MDYFPHQTQFESNSFAYDGQQHFPEQFVHQQQQPDDEFYAAHGFDLNDNVDSTGVKIKPSFSRRDSSSGKLFVGGISWETTEESFFKYFSNYGEILDSVIMLNKHSGKPRGFGFVTFADSSVADEVLSQEHTIDGRVVEVKRTVPREDMDVVEVVKTRKIFVGGIPQSFSDDELKEYFSAYGTIVEYQIMLDRVTGRSRGFGFVTFDNEDSVEKVFSVGKIHELGGKQVEIKRAEPKRTGGDYTSSSQKLHGGFGSGRDGFRGHGSRGWSDGKRGRMYTEGGMSGAYSNSEGTYSGSSAATYVGYGGYGYGYGYGYGGPMYCFGGYGVNPYGNPGGYAGFAAHGRAGWYNRVGGYDSGKAIQKDDGLNNARYHPYWK